MSDPINCPSCNAPVDLPATACPYCGAALNADPRSAPTMLASASTLPPLPRFESSAAAMDEIKRFLRAGNKVGAVQVHREYFSTSLKEAKNAVEAIESDLKFQDAPKPPADDEPPAFARPEAPAVAAATPTAASFDAPQQPPAWRNWAIGCSVAFVLFCCLCVVLPALLYMVMGAQSGGF
ncbi:MAG TPA: hypothetical protein DCG54_13240 [Anaerolineae bacterium]|nr:hypothetical protein [Anaerolineae bacterium]